MNSPNIASDMQTMQLGAEIAANATSVPGVGQAVTFPVPNPAHYEFAQPGQQAIFWLISWESVHPVPVARGPFLHYALTKAGVASGSLPGNLQADDIASDALELQPASGLNDTWNVVHIEDSVNTMRGTLYIKDGLAQFTAAHEADAGANFHWQMDGSWASKDWLRAVARFALGRQILPNAAWT